jgi:hypothetical protein
MMRLDEKAKTAAASVWVIFTPTFLFAGFYNSDYIPGGSIITINLRPLLLWGLLTWVFIAVWERLEAIGMRIESRERDEARLAFKQVCRSCKRMLPEKALAAPLTSAEPFAGICQSCMDEATARSAGSA